MVMKMSFKIQFDPEQLQIIKRFISIKVQEAHTEGVVVGVSGGLDSAVVLKIAIELFSQDKVSAV